MKIQKTILLIDDDPIFSEGMKILLEDEGYKVKTSTNGKAILNKIEKNKPHLILLDYLLINQTGIEILLEIKKQKNYRNIPSIMMSASNGITSRAKEAGAIAVISKPSNTEKLLFTIKKHLNLL